MSYLKLFPNVDSHLIVLLKNVHKKLMKITLSINNFSNKQKYEVLRTPTEIMSKRILRGK